MTSNLTDDMAYHAKGQRTFVLVMLVSCLVLQRVGLPAGADAVVSIAAPVGGMLAIWYIWTGVLSFDRKRVGIMLGLVGVALISVNLHRNVPIAMVTRNSAFSLFFWLCLTAFGTLRFTKPMDERVFFAILIRCLAFIAISGIAQFFAQFVGIKVFSFGGLLPAHFSMERFYNVEIPLGTSSITKANGFFLVEPSTFSQFMALALICEWLEQRRIWFIGLFLFGLFCSASGTGWLIVGAFLAYSALAMGGRGLKVAFIFAGAIMIAFVAVSFVFPAITDSLAGRTHEFGVQGTSGNARFVTPVLVLKQVLHVAPYALFTGVGPGGSESLAGITYEYAMNGPIKIALEYGIFGLLFYLTLIFWNRRTPRQNAVLIPALVLLLFAGGNEHFPPILFPVLLITTIANLKPEEAPIAVRATASLGGNNLPLMRIPNVIS